jgi:hypothetical protein
MDSAPSRLRQAIRNNALWCDLICRTHGQTTEWSNDLWRTLQPPPRFYPGVVTLTEDVPLQHLSTLPRLGAIKDSFASLDLESLDYRPLFDASWLWRDPATLPIKAPDSVGWQLVQTPRQLAQWEAAWAGHPAQAEPALFLPALLSTPNLHFIAAYDQDQIVAGAIAYQTDAIIGLSNLFAPEADPAPYWAGCLAKAQALYPELSLVDYEHGPSLDIALALGFEAIGPLRVWLPQHD